MKGGGRKENEIHAGALVGSRSSEGRWSREV